MNSYSQTIILVHFGTSYDVARARTIDVLEKEIQEEYPKARVITAFTSEVVRSILRKRDILYPNVAEALETAKEEGAEKVVLLVSLLLRGEEYEKVEKQAEPFAESFQKLKISRPLLEEGCVSETAEALAKIYPLEKKQLAIFMGHGTRYESDSVYAELGGCLREKGYAARIATIEGGKDLEDILTALPPKEETDILLLPLLYVAGDHATNDMVKNEDSWKNILMNIGYEVDYKIVGLGEHEEIRKIYKKYLAELTN
ncbi:MAG: hypothetical protein GX260_05170 [Tissierellia bacterium]|nr:sirohydrochlorin cobaltochelatase [Bacillota bacterium]NLL23154.1 hypothetical protein [Tissierellia bacterium]